MTDFENKEIQPETEEQAVGREPASAQPPFGAEKVPVTPHLTLEPDPVLPEIPMPPEAEFSAPGDDPFHMPDPPRAPEPPKPEPPQTGPAQQQSQYSAPQYGVPIYGQQTQYNTPPQNTGAPQYGVPTQPVGKTYYNVPPAGYVQKSRLAAGLLAIILGVFGIHNFYLGYNSRAVVQLVVSLVGGLFTLSLATFGIAIWALVEGVLIISAASPARMYDGNGVILKD